MKMNQKMRSGFTLVELLVVIVIIAALAGLTAPMVIRQRKKADQTEAVSNARQIGLALFEFETAYGSFPDNSTGTEVTANTGSALTFGGSAANDYFRQLIAAEISQSEAMFYAKTAFSKKPDNVFNTAQNALAAGEVGFGYIMNGNVAFSTAGNPARPIVVAPLAFPFSTGQFDVDLYDAKAVVLRIDNSVQSIPILRQSKLAQLGGTKNLLQTGDDTVWGTGVTPTIINPQAKQ
jgi:prepilin-type N-terminal cleavage/methylation domain-containing protein